MVRDGRGRAGSGRRDLAVMIDGVDAVGFSVTTAPEETVASGAPPRTCVVTFAPSDRGMKNAVLHIASSDFDENPFDIALTGVAANRPPVPGADTITRNPASTVKVLVTTLLANDSDADSDSLVLTTVGAAAPAGATVSRSGADVIYEPPAGFTGAGSFTYVVSDGMGGSSIGTVAVIAVNDPGLKILREGNSFRLFGFGKPGRTYTVQFTDDLQTPDWQTLSSNTSNAQGAFEHLDTPPPGTISRFYRTILP